ncbi:phage tail protein, partial [Escherichia coli]
AATPKAVKAAYDLANGKYTAQDATTAQKGIVQLSSATNSTSESQAATPKAVKAAYDLANGKYTAQDATTAQKGIVQLSSATNSTSETLAATPKAVKAANDNANGRVPSARKVNGKALSADITLTPKDIGTLNSTTMSFSGGAGWFKLATVTMPQASSVVSITLIGGAGFNVGSPQQAGISELVLRAGNGNPKGITGALWQRTSTGFTNFAWVNTSGDTYDIYVAIGNYATGVNIQWDSTSSFDYGTKSTNNTGAHTHSLSGSTNAAGNHSHRDGRRFNPSVFKDTYQYGYTSSGQNTWGVQGSVGMSTGWLANTSTDGNHSHSLSGTAASAGAHAHTVGIGAHTHSVAIGSHGHTITVNAAGNAENTVKNIAFNYIVRLA